MHHQADEPEHDNFFVAVVEGEAFLLLKYNKSVISLAPIPISDIYLLSNVSHYCEQKYFKMFNNCGMLVLTDNKIEQNC